MFSPFTVAQAGAGSFGARAPGERADSADADPSEPRGEGEGAGASERAAAGGARAAAAEGAAEPREWVPHAGEVRAHDEWTCGVLACGAGERAERGVCEEECGGDGEAVRGGDGAHRERDSLAAGAVQAERGEERGEEDGGREERGKDGGGKENGGRET